MSTLWDIITGAPWWVYLIFVYLLVVGIGATRHRDIPVKHLVIIPVFFTGWSFYLLYGKLTMGMTSLIFWWIASLIVGAVLGVLEVRKWHFEKDKSRGLLRIPGNYSTLILLMSLFVLKFFWGYIYAVETKPSYWIYLFDTISSSLVCGIFIGRAGFFFKSYLC